MGQYQIVYQDKISKIYYGNKPVEMLLVGATLIYPLSIGVSSSIPLSSESISTTSSDVSESSAPISGSSSSYSTPDSSSSQDYYTPLYFTALEDDVEIWLTYNYDVSQIYIQYSLDGYEWITYTKDRRISLQKHSLVYFRNTTNTLNASIDHVTFGINGTASASGNIMSMINYSDLTEYCFYNLFYGCTGLTSAPKLPATTLAPRCYYDMFYGCTGLTSAPELPAETLAEGCYKGMFGGCTGLTSAPELPAETLAVRCYYDMFFGCTGLTSAPELPAETLAKECYERMFYRCTGLTSAPELPATDLTGCYDCYSRMFEDCTGLTSAPELPATTLAEGCYRWMFEGCTGLTSAPELPAKTLAKECYDSMFGFCTGLTSAPELPATTLAERCYLYMFYRCKGLTSAPELPAKTLAEGCYLYMFQGCKGLTSAPELPAETLVDRCYDYMFNDCTALSEITVSFTEWTDNCTTSWVEGVAEYGIFTGPDNLEISFGSDHIPEGWDIKGVCICSVPANATDVLVVKSDGTELNFTNSSYYVDTKNNNTENISYSNGSDIAGSDKIYIRNLSDYALLGTAYSNSNDETQDNLSDYEISVYPPFKVVDEPSGVSGVTTISYVWSSGSSGTINLPVSSLLYCDYITLTVPSGAGHVKITQDSNTIIDTASSINSESVSYCLYTGTSAKFVALSSGESIPDVSSGYPIIVNIPTDVISSYVQ